jgi:hypothetical protein
MRRRLLFVMLAGWCLQAPLPHAQIAEEIYLSPVVGDGGDGPANRFRSYCTDLPGASSIDLRTDRKSASGYMLCSSATLPSAPGIIPLVHARNGTFSPAVKAALGAGLGRGVVATDVGELLKELLVDTGRIKPSRDGKLKIWLGGSEPLYARTSWAPFEDGGLLADAWNTMQPAVSWAATLATETFPTNGNLDGSTQEHGWSETNGTGWSVSSNRATANAAGIDARANVDLDTDDHEVSLTIVNLVLGSATFAECGPIARKDATTARTWYAFNAELASSGDTNHWYLFERLTGTVTQLGSTNNTDWSANDVAMVRVDGSEVTGLVNGSVFVGPVTDPSPIGSGNLRAGMNFNANNSGFSCTADNWAAQDVAAGFGPLRRRAS